MGAESTMPAPDEWMLLALLFTHSEAQQFAAKNTIVNDGVHDLIVRDHAQHPEEYTHWSQDVKVAYYCHDCAVCLLQLTLSQCTLVSLTCMCTCTSLYICSCRRAVSQAITTLISLSATNCSMPSVIQLASFFARFHPACECHPSPATSCGCKIHAAPT